MKRQYEIDPDTSFVIKEGFTVGHMSLNKMLYYVNYVEQITLCLKKTSDNARSRKNGSYWPIENTPQWYSVVSFERD